jgi:hypothetical protein
MIYVYIVEKHRKLPLPIYESTMSVQIEEIEEADPPWLWEEGCGYEPAWNLKPNTEARMSLSNSATSLSTIRRMTAYTSLTNT